MYILIGNAWPYANGSLHIGHIAALLPGDILARYHRAIGDFVYFVSGSDCHGTPVAIRAKQEDKTPEEISDYYHDEFFRIFELLGFSYDKYGKTSSNEHKKTVIDFHKEMYEEGIKSGLIYEKATPQAYCVNCRLNMVDRYVVGKCPSCGEISRGDQCDACGTVQEPENLIEPVCSICNTKAEFRETNHIYLAVSKLENELSDFLSKHTAWRKNAVSFTSRYIREGLRDRAVTRSLDWGIDIPKEGYEDKKIYIWAENVIGYYSMSKCEAERRKDNFEELWSAAGNAKHYYVHGKDNIPFHTIILPALLLAHGGGLRLPDEIVSSEYLTLEGRKISTSQNHAIWAKDIAEKYNSDSIRYYMIANGPEKRDSDFTMREFINCNNSELLGAYGNFVNRSLVFINKYFDNTIPHGILDGDIKDRIEALFKDTSEKIEGLCFKEAIEGVFEFVRYANKYYDSEKPWTTRTTDNDKCRNTIYNCVQIIANLSVLLNPFLPFSSEKISEWLSVSCGKWEFVKVAEGEVLPKAEILFERL